MSSAGAALSSLSLIFIRSPSVPQQTGATGYQSSSAWQLTSDSSGPLGTGPVSPEVGIPMQKEKRAGQHPATPSPSRRPEPGEGKSNTATVFAAMGDRLHR
ncbi:hypothetical protein GCM10023238_08470 [Streptomyces heliomycini]